ncbi:LysR family transcriptional regulator ArgP [Pollutimonas harenae]|uniref:LysR family transcriptional regulator ArgP n=1 Tax=Pollutimonas harenae TaxID=657015 RepID=A0A853GZB2_9BURK|nr:LysR family transcriptional regulator ArgP [Pollutimonas harenae]NYT85100.1 LysR family transcriptional regulator ArgP [Pollutimonas harenae]TEA72518.1 LysR family transcriptional regulator ArgP [Pollutimonas harenae]
MKIDHGNLRALAAVVREGSFERAAEALHVTPSAVSQRIKSLEERMGRLLVQRTIPASATPDGQVLVQLAEQTALLEHDAINRLGIDEHMPQASLAVAVNHDSLETWFMQAAELFASRTRTTLDMQSEDQDHTAGLLRQGAVLGAVTTLADPVQGCRHYALGSMRYVATCSPAFHARYFATGLNSSSLAAAPVLVFNRKDALQARFAQKIMRDAPWRPAVWWLPSSRAFVQATLAGLGWTMNPLPLIQQHLDDGLLVPLRARAWEDVPLYWQHWRVNSLAMDALTESVLAAAKVLIRKR